MFYRKFVFGDAAGEMCRAGMKAEAGNGEGALESDSVRKGEGAPESGGGQPGESAFEISGVRKGQESRKPEIVPVRAGDLYSPSQGFGFVTERNRREQELLRLPELNSAFDTLYWYQGEDLSHVEEDSDGCFLDSDREIAALEAAGAAFPGEERRIPLSFKADVPRQGNYRVTVVIHAEEPAADVLIFTGRRRLGYLGMAGKSADEARRVQSDGTGDQADMVSEVGSAGASQPDSGADAENAEAREPANSGIFVYTMSVNVCDIIPRGNTEAYTDRTLDITVLARRPRLSQVVVEELECPTLFIAGDSTVTDQSAEYPYAPGTSYSGWGQMISGYLDQRTAVSNHAHSGLTTASFREEGHYEIVEKYIRPGDYLLIQFAHNDQKLESLKAEEGYKANLLRYIRECRDRGAFPVLVTPLARNTWKGNDGSYNDLLEEYAAVCIRLGAQENVPVVDLHGRSMDFIVKTGLEASKAYFFPGDYTHSNDYGAYLMAGMVAEEIVKACGKREEGEYRFLAECVTGGFGKWAVPERIVLPPRPERYENVPDPGDAPALSDIERLEEPADRVSALDMVIRTARFFPTNVYNDMFSDVVGHEWYAGTVECAYQNGMIDPGLVEEGKFFPLRPVTLEEFLVFAVNGYRSRRKLPDINGNADSSICVYDKKCKSFTKFYVRAACALGLIAADGSEIPDRVITRGEAVEICRKLGI